MAVTASDEILLLKELADISDEISISRYHAQDLKIETKPDLTPVTDADRSVEKALRKILQARRSQELIIGEEFGSPEEIAPNSRYWVIDPIDGT